MNPQIPNAPIPGTRLTANLEPISPLMVEASERNKLYIFSVNPHPQEAFAGMGRYVVPACPKGARVSAALVVPGIYFYTDVSNADGFVTEFKWSTIEGKDLAQDILGKTLGKDPSCDLTRLGVFLSLTPEPSDEMVEEARANLNLQYANRVQAADRAYEINGGQEVVNGVARSNISVQDVEAAKELGLDKPWARKMTPVSLVACPACDEMVKPTAAICSHCDAILDEAKARKFFPHKFQEERRGPGRPPKEV